MASAKLMRDSYRKIVAPLRAPLLTDSISNFPSSFIILWFNHLLVLMPVYRPSFARLRRVPLPSSAMGPVSRSVSFLSRREEDQHPDYDAEKYYPARVGETISKRYFIISKLGWGSNSTVWLARDTNRLVQPLLLMDC